jgi:hypothetical protein
MMDDQAIRSVVTRLSRQHPSGGQVIERAAVLAEGSESGAILDWITSHDGLPESRAGVVPARGLHQGKLEAGRGLSSANPRRYVLPPGALS